MNNNIKMIIIVIFGIIVLYIFQKNNDYNLNRTISACIVAQKKSSTSFDADVARKYCEEEIKKQKK